MSRCLLVAAVVLAASAVGLAAKPDLSTALEFVAMAKVCQRAWFGLVIT